MRRRRPGPRRYLGIVLATVSLGLAACGGSDTGGAVSPGGPIVDAGGSGQSAVGLKGPPGALRADVPAAVAATGVLRVGAAVGRAPLLFYGTGTRQLEGIDADLLQGIGHRLGLQINVVNQPLDQLGTELLAHHTDVFMSGFVDLKAFQKAGIDFVDYLSGRSAVLVRQGDPGRVQGPEGVCGKRIGVLGGTAQQVALTALDQACAAHGRPRASVRLESDHAVSLNDLVTGQLDALLDDAVVAQYTAQVSTGAATVEVAGNPVDPLPYGIGVAKDQPQLRNAIQSALRAMVADGSYDAVLNHWGGEEAALHTITVNAGP